MVDVAAPVVPPAPKGALPKGVVSSRFWRETPDGEIVKHDRERPVDEATDMPVGVWWLCLQGGCKTGEWVFPQSDGTSGRPKRRYCPDHGDQILPGRADPTASNPKDAARSWLRQALAERAAAARETATAAASARIDLIRAAGREEAERIASDVREHVPSAVVSVAALAGDLAVVSHLDGLSTYALGVGLSVGGAVLAYVAVYVGEVVYARRMGYTLRELPARLRVRARARARWVASGVLATGVWLVLAETVGARVDNLRGLLMVLFGAVLAGVVNYVPWANMVARRKAEAAARQAAAEAAARAEEERLAAEARRQAEAEAARKAAEAAALAAAKKIVREEDDRITAGSKFAARWQQVAEAARTVAGNGAGFEIWRTSVVVDATRKLTASDAEGDVVVGWEFLVRAEPGVLTPRAGSDVSPFVTMKRWLADMLEIDVAMLDLQYQPTRMDDGADKPQPLINHGLVMLSERFPLGKPVSHPGASGCYIDDRGTRWGYAGRDLRGRAVHRRLWTPGQAGGAGRYGVTGTGKSVVTQVTAYNDLLLGIFPIIHDAGKNAMDFTDFYGIFPVGHTIEHREVIRESLWAEMKRRQAWINMRTATGLGGMEVIADPTWDPAAGGPPIRCTWEEFHMHMRDPKFVAWLGEVIRLQRATAMMADLATQGTGLADMGDNNLREQINEICMQLMRVTDHTARLAGYTGGLKPSDLPSLPGMMVMQEMRGEPMGYRSAFIPRNPQNPESLIYRMRRPNGTPDGEQILFAPDLPPETIEVFTQHGLMDLWELGKTRSGRERLQSEVDPVESTDYPPSLAALFASTGQASQPAVKPHMRAEDVVLALLKHESDQGRPGLTQQEILGSEWWGYVSGEWVKNAGGRPSHTTVSRACNRLGAVTEQQSDAGLAPLIVTDGGKPARWSLLASGVERGEQMLNLLRSAGALGPQGKAHVAASGLDVAAMERQAMLEAEQEALIQSLVREAAESVRR